MTRTHENRFRSTIETPLGELIVVFDETRALHLAGFSSGQDRTQRWLQREGGPWRESSPPERIANTFARYFSGELAALDELACTASGTPFQRRVWAALRDIPVGSTTTYGALAERIDSPRAVRAVGLANGSNPIGIVIPCHRVIGADGSLTGYGGGLERKRWLLQHEGCISQGTLPLRQTT